MARFSRITVIRFTALILITLMLGLSMTSFADAISNSGIDNNHIISINDAGITVHAAISNKSNSQGSVDDDTVYLADYNNVYYAIQSYSERGYTAYADQAAIGWAEIRKHNGDIYFFQQRISGAVYGVPVEGDIPALINELKANGTSLSLSVFLADSGIFRELLDKPAVQDQVISDMVEALDGIRYYDYRAPRNEKGFHPHYLVTDKNGSVIEYDGIIIDFEQLFDDGSYRDKYNMFLKKLKDKLPADKKLTVCIPPRRKPPVGYFDGYDYSFIGQLADEVILMAHDYQWSDGSIRATAPISYVREALEFAVKDIPREKILLQVSLSPVVWENGSLKQQRPGYGEMLGLLAGKGTNQVRVISVTPESQRYDERTQTGYVRLEHEVRNSRYSSGESGTADETSVVVEEFYYENARSIAQKRALAGQFGIKGMSAWRLGLGAHEPLEEMLKSQHVRAKVESFVKRLYNIALDREAEPGGLAHFTDRLITGDYTASYVIQFMLLDAPEFLMKKHTNEKFIEICYRAFLDRMPDDDGMVYWSGQMNKGYSKRWVMANILNAPPKEFDRLCKDAGITTGQIHTRAVDHPR
jgi:hypothetical protein